MKPRRRRARARATKNQIEPAAAEAAFTEAEEAFFRAGTLDGDPAPVESFADLDEDYRPQTLWGLVRRLFSRTQAA